MKHSPEGLVRGKVQIASLPTVFARINEAIEDPECSFTEIGGIIGGDPALSARLLKLANSSFYGFPSRIETITHAITVIGMSQLRDLALATTIVSQFKGLPESTVNMESFWYHSICVGLAARIVAIYHREPNAERYYVLGMLHDLGHLVMFLNMPDEMRKIFERCKENRSLVYQGEREALGFDHGDVGGALLRAWDLPARLEEPVACHHKPSAAARYSMEAAIVHLADIISHALEIGHSAEDCVAPLDTRAWETIAIPVSQLSSIVNQIDRQLPDAVQMFMPGK